MSVSLAAGRFGTNRGTSPTLPQSATNAAGTTPPGTRHDPTQTGGAVHVRAARYNTSASTDSTIHAGQFVAGGAGYLFSNDTILREFTPTQDYSRHFRPGGYNDRGSVTYQAASRRAATVSTEAAL